MLVNILKHAKLSTKRAAIVARSTDAVGAARVAKASFVNNNKQNYQQAYKAIVARSTDVVGAARFAFYYMLVNILKHRKIID